MGDHIGVDQLRDKNGFNCGSAVNMETELEENAESLDIEDTEGQRQGFGLSIWFDDDIYL